MTGLLHTQTSLNGNDATTCKISDAQHHLPSRRWVWTGSDRHNFDFDVGTCDYRQRTARERPLPRKVPREVLLLRR
ncbi:Hypothetical protein MUW33_2137 [Mycobacterium canetti]|uniref:hypothetical protein n=1 Tax=Mycobacterium canetti TaxID=78331 RepID=UPI002D7822A1|nr:hypothetical protein [Mycobacterium canetti]WRO42086.1 Hypothetical protein MUW33_2137 [Mycobacterium canetti]